MQAVNTSAMDDNIIFSLNIAIYWGRVTMKRYIQDIVVAERNLRRSNFELKSLTSSA